MSMSKKTKAEEQFQIKGGKETGQLNTVCDPGLDPVLEGKKCYKEHDCIN